MKKKLVLFSAGAVVIAGGLVYILGVYPPASTRDAQGAIGQRQVYRDPQASDAAVTPGSAPVAASTLTPAQTKKMEEISSQIAMGFISNLKNDLDANLHSQLIALLAHSDLKPDLTAEVASNLSEQFSAQFLAAMQQQLMAAVQADLVQAVTAQGLKWELSSAMQQQIVAQITSSAAANFNANLTSQLSQGLYNGIHANLTSNLSSGMISQISTNVASQLAPGLATQFASSLAQNLTAQFASGLRF
jgi:hypothetical protein